MIRKTLFWIHLVAGLTAAIGVFTMCVTGVLLTYERQIKAMVAETGFVPQAEQVDRLSLEQLTLRAQELNADLAGATITVSNNPGAPVIFSAGRRARASLNPYTGEEMAPAAPWVTALFSDIRGMHRWFNFSSENRDIPRSIIDISNLIFIFLIISGLYLWLPRVWKWAVLKTRLVLQRDMRNSRMRDFNWHHVFGIWCANPLLVLAVSGTMFTKYRWSGDLLYAALGTERPQASSGNQQTQRVEAGSALISIDQLFDIASAHNPDWRSIALSLPEGDSRQLRAQVDTGNGAQPHLRDTLLLDRVTGNVAEVQTFGQLPFNQKIRPINRFLHTGEVLGIWGQTVAGIVTFFGIFMVYTGVVLSYRRLLQPLLARRSKTGVASGAAEPAEPFSS